MKKYNNYAFIDGNNLHLGTQSEGWLTNHKLLFKFLSDNYGVTKAFYLGYVEQENLLYRLLLRAGFTLIFKRTKRDSNNKIIGNVDAELVFHTIIKIQNYNKAIIVAGDDDYYCLLKYLAYHKKLSKILIPSKKDCPKLFKNSLLSVYLQYLLNKKDEIKHKDCPIKR